MTILDVPYFSQETEDTCAPARLRMALAFRFPGTAVSEATLARQCGCVQGLGSLVDKVYRTAHRNRLAMHWLAHAHIAEEVEAALQAGCPVLANVQLRLLPYYLPSQPPQAWHLVLIVGMDNRYDYLHDPDPYWGGPRRTVERSVFFASWTNHPYSAYRV